MTRMAWVWCVLAFVSAYNGYALFTFIFLIAMFLRVAANDCEDYDYE